MSTWYKVSTSGTLYGRLELPDEFEQYIRRLEAERDEARDWAIHFRRLYESATNCKPVTCSVDMSQVRLGPPVQPFVPDEVHITRQSKRSKGGSKNG